MLLLCASSQLGVAQNTYVISTARAESAIKKEFPYDITLANADSVIQSSEAVLGNSDKPIVLLFWLTTCYPCHAQMDNIKKSYAAWESSADFRFLAISTDYNHNFQKFKNQVAKYKWPFEMYNDVNKEFAYVMPGGLNGLPQTFIIYKNEIVFHKRKYVPGDEQELLNKLIELSPKKMAATPTVTPND